jgi:hypothetical protein
MIGPYAKLEEGEKSYGGTHSVQGIGTYTYDVPVPPDATAIDCGADMN